jgi:hypothetical protein
MSYTISPDPIVSVLCATYNHEKYIGDALDSFLVQRTSFPFEICVGEDDSSDRTREICIEYAKKYPEQIRLFLRDRKDVFYINGAPTGRSNIINTLRQCRGKYIAFCDGDDMWIDPLKLEKQVSFLEANPQFSMSYHQCRVVYHDGRIENRHIPAEFHTLNLHLLTSIENPIHSCTALFRKSAVINNLDKLWDPEILVADFALWLLCVKQGPIACLPEVMALYRHHGSGLWSSQSREQELLRTSQLYLNIRKWFEPSIQSNLTNQACRFMLSRMQRGFQTGDQLVARDSYNKITEMNPQYWYEIVQAIIRPSQ